MFIRINLTHVPAGIPRERIIAFGDEKNALEMIEYAGHGVAMANAIPETKDPSRRHYLIQRRRWSSYLLRETSEMLISKIKIRCHKNHLKINERSKTQVIDNDIVNQGFILDL